MQWQPRSGRPRVAVLAGGQSAEREISLASGINVAAALDDAGYDVALLDPAVEPLATIDWSRFDACFIALHGGAGEDGRVQQQLERWAVPYTGSGPAASRLAMSKSASKERFIQANLATAPYVVFHRSEPLESLVERVGTLGYPVVVKPDAQGSSIGVGFARDAKELALRVGEGLAYDHFAIAEPVVEGRELTVAVIDRQTLPVLEIVTPRAFFDFAAKQHADSTEYRFDTGLSDDQTQRVQQAAVAAAEALGTRGLVRVDMIVDRLGQPWLLEVNTVPGMTARSLAPKAAAQAGMSLAMLCDRLIRDCLPSEVMR